MFLHYNYTCFIWPPFYQKSVGIKMLSNVFLTYNKTRSHAFKLVFEINHMRDPNGGTVKVVPLCAYCSVLMQ